MKEINVIGIAVEIIYYVESLRKKDFYEGKSVKNLGDINFSDFDYMIVAYHDFDEIESFINKTRDDYVQNKHKVVDIITFLSVLKYSYLSICPYKSVSLSCGIKYIFQAKDEIIGGSMLAFDTNFSEKLILAFLNLLISIIKKG